jgi:predicted acyl esterase
MFFVGIMKNIALTICLVLFIQLADGQTRHDVTIPMSDGAQLDATYFVPSPPSGTYPAIVFVHGFGLDKYTTVASCSTFALSGYVTLTYSVRGHGNSTGGCTIMSTREREDFHEVLEYLRGLQKVDTSLIGVSGGSQGGLHGLWAAADHLSVKAITADVIVPNWASDMLANGCIRRTLLLLLQGSAVHYDAVRDTLWNFVRQDDYDTFKSRFTPERDVDTTQLNSSTIPMLRLNKWQDYYFTAQDGIEAYLRYGGPKKIYLGTRGHFSDQVESERLYQYDQVSRWLGYFLKNQQNGILNESPVTYAYSSLPMDTAGYFLWTRVGESSWPPSGIQPVRFYLNADSSLSYTAPSAQPDSFILNNNYLNPSYTFDTAYIEGFRGSRFDAALPKHTIAFTSSPLPSDISWIGVPKMNLSVRSAFEKFPLQAQIYEVDSLGDKYFINRINYTARHWSPGTQGIVDAEGAPHTHKFMKGNRIRIELTNIDVTNRIVWGEYPFVVPIFAQASATIYSGLLHDSYIELPMTGTPVSVSNDYNQLPSTIQLFQNYPNPFNPTTTILFEISEQSFVTLKIYNVLGQEVGTLVNGMRQAGSYSVRVDVGAIPPDRRRAGHESSLTSGVYLYRLQAGIHTEVKKMLLIK